MNYTWIVEFSMGIPLLIDGRRTPNTINKVIYLALYITICTNVVSVNNISLRLLYIGIYVSTSEI